MEVATMDNEIQDKVLEEVNAEINESIDEAKNKLAEQELEIEVTDEKPKVTKEPEKTQKPVKTKEQEEDDTKFSNAVQTRIKKILAQKKEADERAQQLQNTVATLNQRLEKIEKSNETQGQNQLAEHYNLVKRALGKAIEEGDTEKQVKFNEELVDIKTTIALQNQSRANKRQNETYSPNVGRAQQQATNPAPEKAMTWWKENEWFNSKGFEKETAMARAIDVQLDIEGFDKNDGQYYAELNNRLQKSFPELISTKEVTNDKPRQSRQAVAPTTGGQVFRGNRVRMTSDQLRMARELGITDPEHIKKYAKEIQSLSRKDT
tara:strand:- start:11918 stop:12877 length:960 start_codon:yes stop_codon:yes gene_type:complete